MLLVLDIIQGLIIIVLLVDFINVDWLIDVTVPSPTCWCQEFIELDVVLESLRWSIGIPQLKTPLNIILGHLPLTRDIALKRLSEDRIKLLDVLLQANKITIKRKHVVNSLVLKALNVDSFILCQLDKVSNLVLLWDVHLLLVSKTEIVSVDT